MRLKSPLFSFVLMLLFISLPIDSRAQDGRNAPVSPGETAVQADILPPAAVPLGEQEQNGILAQAWFYRPPASATGSSPDGNRPNAVLFLRFLSVENYLPVEKGLVAYKIENEEAVAPPARKMLFREGYFVADLEPLSRGKYLLRIGSKLEDEKKRQFHFDLTIR